MKCCFSFVIRISILLMVIGGGSCASPLPDSTQFKASTAPNPATTPVSSPTPSPALSTTTKIDWLKTSTPVILTVDTVNNKATYSSGGVDVTGYFYKPSGSGPFSAMIVLHGKSGQNLTTRDRALWFAQQGYVTLAPDYFSPVGMTAEKFDVSFYKTNVDRVREILGHGLEALKSLSYVAGEHLGVYGHSLGGYLSFILGTRDDVRAVISCSGAYAPTAPAKYPLADICTQMKAAVLMFHGDADTYVPIDHANTTSNLLKNQNKQYEYVVYPGVDHVFDVPRGSTYSASATADFQQKIVTFLKSRLQ